MRTSESLWALVFTLELWNGVGFQLAAKSELTSIAKPELKPNADIILPSLFSTSVPSSTLLHTQRNTITFLFPPVVLVSSAPTPRHVYASHEQISGISEGCVIIPARSDVPSFSCPISRISVEGPSKIRQTFAVIEACSDICEDENGCGGPTSEGAVKSVRFKRSDLVKQSAGAC
ncbi:hypothetical protein BDN72DRAFT_904338 [Pluteus cervinus]|uniref:Uncharacterized protein n=1 Tax=Pluteus cervinus TaxID=181527 RepID=A0ACD3A5K3_9AGAR|nr:hypothetical protein BDN72DRAFT_904338 [Pluteus cervinus]